LEVTVDPVPAEVPTMLSCGTAKPPVRVDGPGCAQPPMYGWVCWVTLLGRITSA
jgi:hypothetical protein